MSEKEKSRRVRQRRPELQLQAALNDAEELGRATPTLENVERMRLVKARLNVLKSRVAQKLRSEVAELTRRVGELVTDNNRLRQELAARPIRHRDKEIDEALARFKNGNGKQSSAENENASVESSQF